MRPPSVISYQRVANSQYPEMETYNATQLLDFMKNKALTTVLFLEVQSDLGASEEIRMNKDIQDLIERNTKTGGSESGYFFENELFAIGSSYNIGSIGPIHAELYEDAYMIQQNKEELQQDLTYIGNFLSVLASMTDNYAVLIANVPMELAKFSRSIRVLNQRANTEFAHMNTDTQTWEDSFRFDREQSEFATFFMHYDRVEPRLKRYLFRRVTQ